MQSLDKHRGRHRHHRAQAVDRGRGLRSPTHRYREFGCRAGSIRRDRMRRRAPTRNRTRRSVRDRLRHDVRRLRMRFAAPPRSGRCRSRSRSAIRPSSAIRMAPVPVPRSAIRKGAFASATVSSTASTSVSVSLRGISVAGETARRRPQNSCSPRIRAIGSPASRRAARHSSSLASSSASKSRPRVARIVGVRPVTRSISRRASRSAPAISYPANNAASFRLASSMLDVTQQRLVQRAERPGVRSSTHRPVHPKHRLRSRAAACRASG